MYKNILIPIALDHERDPTRAFEVAEALLADGGKVTALTVVEEIPPYVAQYLPADQLQRNMAAAQDVLAGLVKGRKGVDVAVVSGHAAQTILDFAEKAEVDLIVIQSHRPGLQDYLLGSTAARVVRHAGCAVHVLR
ncbi:MAG: universal stress protein [Alphaproteobacteria bacterium]|nr:MAG: universal stress protein [Alphaproteobacteria bacterium]